MYDSNNVTTELSFGNSLSNSTVIDTLNTMKGQVPTTPGSAAQLIKLYL